MTAPTERYVEEIADAHGISGHAVTPGGEIVYAAYRGGEYELCTPEGRLTETAGDLTDPQWLDGRDAILALRDSEGNERHDLVEVDPDTGALSPILDDDFLNRHPRQDPADPSRVAFVSNRDRSLDLYTVDVDSGSVTKRSEADETVVGYAWSPDGDRLVYQAGLVDDSSLRLVDLAAGTDDALVDEPDSEQSLSYVDAGRGTWSEEGIVFTTNHETGYRELAITDASGEYELHYVNERDKYDPRWTPDGDVVFVESRGGNRAVRRLADGGVTTIEPTGMNMDVKIREDGAYYTHHSTETAGDLKREGETLVGEGQPDVPTVAPTEITYESFDGREIAARLYTPEEPPIAGVIKPHGGPPSQHFTQLDAVSQGLVQAGFEVLAPDFRGSIGYGREFRKASDGDLGGDDLEDVVAGANYLRDRGRSRIGITGASYGGYMTLMAVGATGAFDAGASVCGVVDWRTVNENARQYLGDYLIRKLGGTPDENPALYEDRSPISHVDDIDVPLLIVQGANDPRVPRSEAETLASSLRERDVPHEYLLFEDEGHSVVRTENRVEYVSRVVSFFESHL